MADVVVGFYRSLVRNKTTQKDKWCYVTAVNNKRFGLFLVVRVAALVFCRLMSR